VSRPTPLAGRGERRRTPVSGSILLAEPGAAWRVEAGSGELLATRLESGRPIGTRIPLGRVREGDWIFSLVEEAGIDDRALLLFASDDLVLLERSAGAAAECGVEVADGMDAMDRWVSRVATLLAEDARPIATEILSAGRSRSLSPGQVLAPEHGDVLWIEIEAGEGRLLANDELAVSPESGPIPLPGQLWILATSELRVRARARDGADPAAREAGLRFLHRAIREELRRRAHRQEEEERERVRHRERAERERVSAAWARMGSLLDPMAAPPRKEGALFAAAARIGEEIGVEMRAPLAAESRADGTDPVEAIARASHVRMRRVELSGRWWRWDSGSLLAFRRDTGAPVALLRRTRGYLLHDPQTAEEIPLDAKRARELEPGAALFYRPFPAELRRPHGIFPFALAGRSGDIVFIIAIAVLATLLGMLIPQALALVLDGAIPNADRSQLLELGSAMLAAVVGIGLLRATQGLAAIRLSTATEVDAQAAMWDRLLRLRASFFKKYATGDLLSRVTAVSEVNRELNGATLQGLVTAGVSLLNFGLLLHYSAPLAALAALFGLLVVAVTLGSGLLLRRINQETIEHQGKFYGTVVQLVNAVSKIQVAGAERRAFALWMDGQTRMLSLVQRSRQVIDSVAIFNLAIPVLATICVYLLGARFLFPDGEIGAAPLSVGRFLAFQFALGMFLGGAGTLSDLGVGLLDTLIRAKRMEPVLEEEPELAKNAVDPGTLQGEIAADRIHFRYAADGPKILEDVSIRAKPGEFIAIVGGSGSGKSTLLRLLLGFERPESGEILFDDQNLETLDSTAVRRQIGVVLQSSHIQSGSILENIAGGAAITMAEAWRAAEDAGLGDEIRDMPMEMHTIVSEGGGNFSGGQRQRLMICRAIVRNPRILFLDEATSALDNRTQRIVTESLARRKVTRIVIAHRLSTVRDADRIYVLDRGRLAEEGTHDALVALGGIYARMMARQTG